VHLKTIVLEIVTNSKSEKMWNLFIASHTPPSKKPHPTIKNVCVCGNFQL